MSDGGGAAVHDWRRRLLGTAAAAILTIAAIVLALVGGDGGSGSQPVDTLPHFVDSADLTALEGSLGHPIYWAGERPPKQLELKEEADGSVYLRYLPAGVAAGESPAAYLTVGTYPVPDAQAAVRRAAAAAGVGVGHAAGGGIILANPESEGSVYLAYPGSNLQLEIYDPAPGRSMRLIRSGAIVPVGGRLSS